MFRTTMIAALSLVACSSDAPDAQAGAMATQEAASGQTALPFTLPQEGDVLEKGKISLPEGIDYLVVAGGCFWCVEADFEKQPGVLEAVSGYSGGEKRDATYQSHEGHREAAIIYYDTDKTSYETLIPFFLRTIDVTDAGGQFCDRGYAYTTAIYPKNEEEREVAARALANAKDVLGRDIVTPIDPFTFLTVAEDYHQDYYKSEDRIVSRFGVVSKADAYKGYRSGCRRDDRLRAVWGDEAALAK